MPELPSGRIGCCLTLIGQNLFCISGQGTTTDIFVLSLNRNKKTSQQWRSIKGDLQGLCHSACINLPQMQQTANIDDTEVVLSESFIVLGGVDRRNEMVKDINLVVIDMTAMTYTVKTIDQMEYADRFVN